MADQAQNSPPDGSARLKLKRVCAVIAEVCGYWEGAGNDLAR